MDRQQARRVSKRHILVHNDLGNAAHYHRGVIEKKVGVGDHEGLGFDCMACLIALAFAFEAQINFLGAKLIEGWKERRPFADKVDEIFSHLGLERNTTARPFASVVRLKQFRDSLAHGSPAYVETEDIVELAGHEHADHTDLDADWQRFCVPEAAYETYDDLEGLWKVMLEKSGIPILDTVTRGIVATSTIS